MIKRVDNLTTLIALGLLTISATLLIFNFTQFANLPQNPQVLGTKTAQEPNFWSKILSFFGFETEVDKNQQLSKEELEALRTQIRQGQVRDYTQPPSLPGEIVNLQQNKSKDVAKVSEQNRQLNDNPVSRFLNQTFYKIFSFFGINLGPAQQEPEAKVVPQETIPPELLQLPE